MKKTLLGKLSLVIGMSALLVGCDQERNDQPNSGGDGETPTTAELAREALFGPWMSRAQVQFEMEKPEFKGSYYSVIEGRVHEGENQYRTIVEAFDKENYEEWAAFWGLSEEELFADEVILLRAGFERRQSQVFTDTAGNAIHQLVMLRAVGSVAITPPATTGLRQFDDWEKKTSVIPQEVDAAEVIEEVVGRLQIERPESAPLAEEEISAVLIEEKVVDMEPAEVIEVAPSEPKPEEVKVVEQAEPKPEPKPKPVVTRYKVVRGDTLSAIASRNKVSVSALKKANSLRSDVIRLGQVLEIPKR